MPFDTHTFTPEDESGPLETTWLKFPTCDFNFGNLDLGKISAILFQETAFSMLLGLWALIAEFLLIKFSIYDNYPGSAWLLTLPATTWIIILAIKILEKYWLQKGDSPAQRTQRIVLCFGILFFQLLVGSVGLQDREEILKSAREDGWPFNEGWRIPITLTRMFIGSCATMTLNRMFIDLLIKACLFEGFPLFNDEEEDESDPDYNEEVEMRKTKGQSSLLYFDNNDNFNRTSNSRFSNSDINRQHNFSAPVNVDEYDYAAANNNRRHT